MEEDVLENVRSLVLHHGCQVPDNRPPTPRYKDFGIRWVEPIIVLAGEEGAVISLREFPEEVQEAIRVLQEECRSGKHLVRQLGRSKPGMSTSGMVFPQIKEVGIHALSPVLADPGVQGYRVHVAFQVGEESYRSGMGGDGEYRHFLFCYFRADISLALKLVQQCMLERAFKRLEIDAVSVGQRTAALAITHRLDYRSLQHARDQLFREHGLDDDSIQRKREALIERYGLSDDRVADQIAHLRTRQGFDAQTIEAQVKRVSQVLHELRSAIEERVSSDKEAASDSQTAFFSQFDPVKELIERAESMRLEDTTPQD